MRYGLDALLRLNRPLKRTLQVVADLVLITLSFAAAMALRFEGFHFALDPLRWIVLLAVMPVTVVVFARLGLYRAVIRHIAGSAMRAVLVGVLASALTMLIVAQLAALPVPRSVPVIYALVLFILVAGVRFGFRAYVRRGNSGRKAPVLIYGAGEAGRQLVNALHQGPEYDPVAFLDDDPDLLGTDVAGLRVYNPARVGSLTRQGGIKAILLALPSSSPSERRAIIEKLEGLSVQVKSVPGMADIVSGKATFSELKQVPAEDLLGRDAIQPDPDLLAANITGKVVMVSGAAGSIGSELCRQIMALSPRRLVLLDNSEYGLYRIDDELRELASKSPDAPTISPALGSAGNDQLVRTVLRRFEVQTVYHAAAYKHVPLVELNVIEGLRNNVFGTRAIARAASEIGVEAFILISTDKAVRPTNIMGASKRMAELICQALARSGTGTVYSMVRFGNVLGSSGSVIPRFHAQIEDGGPVTVTHPDITRYFMTIPEAAQLVIQAGAMAKGGDLFVLDMGKAVRIVDLARTMIQLQGLKPFVISNDSDTAAENEGDVAIRFTGLRPGEKLHEELLTGNNAKRTVHPRIMTATEAALEEAELEACLQRLQEACARQDLPLIREILMQAPTGYQPVNDIADLIWQEGEFDAAHSASEPAATGVAANEMVSHKLRAMPQR